MGQFKHQKSMVVSKTFSVTGWLIATTAGTWTIAIADAVANLIPLEVSKYL